MTDDEESLIEWYQAALDERNDVLAELATTYRWHLPLSMVQRIDALLEPQ